MADWAATDAKGPAMLVAFSVTPLGGSDSVGDVVAGCVRIVRDSGLAHETNAMFTNVEGEWDEVMPVVRACVDHAAEHAARVSVTMKLDHRPGVTGQLQGKVASVRRHLGESSPGPEGPRRLEE